MNNPQLDPGLSAMLAGTNLSIDPGALLQQPPVFENDTASSSRTTSTSSVPRLHTPDTPETEDDGLSEEEEDDDDLNTTSKKPSSRGKAKMPTKSRTATSSSKSKKGGSTTATASVDKRRRRNLERNRAAASKCRQRKKQWQDGLERKKIELESRYKSLHSEVKELMEEVAQLKNFVMAHAACNDANIDDWIRNEADSFVRRMSGAQMAQNAQAAQNAQVAQNAHAPPQPQGSLVQMQSPTQGQLATPSSMNGMYMSDWDDYTQMS